MKLYAILFAGLVTISSAAPASDPKRAVGSVYLFTTGGGTDLQWTVGGVSNTGEDYVEEDALDVGNAMALMEESARTNGQTRVTASVTGSSGGTLTGEFELDLYSEWTDLSNEDWQEAFDELFDIVSPENYPGALAMTLLTRTDPMVNEGTLTLKFVA